MNINEIISAAKESKGLDAAAALKLFTSDEELDFAEELRRKSFSTATTISVKLDFSPENSLAGLKLRAVDVASFGHRRILLDITELGDHSPSEAVEALLSIERKRDDIRRVDLKLGENIDEKLLTELKASSVASVIFDARSDLPILARSIGIADIGLYTSFTSDEYLVQLEALLHRAYEITPRVVYISHDDLLPLDVFTRICQTIRAAHPFVSLLVEPNTLELAKFANSFVAAPDEKPDKLVNKMIRAGQLPSFCSACRLENRTGEAFCSDCHSGKIHNCCYLNALITLKEFLSDFGSQDTRIVGTDMILRELYNIKNDDIRSLMVKTMKDIRSGQRGIRV